MTFTIEDALISPMGLAVLSGAGLSKATSDNVKHVHCTIDAVVAETATGEAEAVIDLETFRDELGLANEEAFYVCDSTAIPVYGTVLDASGSGIDYVDADQITLVGTAGPTYPETIIVDKDNVLTLKVDHAFVNRTVKFDLYVVKNSGVQEIDIKAQDFGGYYYLEAQTLFRREDTGEDMAAEIIIPKAKVQSGMTISLSASGDPSTFTFTFDAFPAYTRFNKKKKVMCVIQIIGDDNLGTDEGEHKHDPYKFKLENANAVTVGNEDPLTATAGDYFYNTTDTELKQFDGDDWNIVTDIEVVDEYPTPEAALYGKEFYKREDTTTKKVVRE